MGGLMSYGADYDDLFRRAVYVDKILKVPNRLICRCSRRRSLNSSSISRRRKIGLTIPVRASRRDKVIKDETQRRNKDGENP